MSVKDMFEELVVMTEHAGTEKPPAGATLEEILALERHLGLELPQEYKMFLSLANGWEICEHLMLVSTHQIIDGEFDDIDDVRDELDPAYDGCWLIGVVLEEDTGFFLLKSGKEAVFAEAHQSVFADPQGFLELMTEQTEMVAEIVEDTHGLG